MLFESTAKLRDGGFKGFKQVRDLLLSCAEVPDERGNYLVLYLSGHRPEFINPGAGPKYHNGQSLNYPINSLKQRWVDGTAVIYIGQAGGKNRKGEWSNQTLHNRISTYMKYGQGYDVSHRGGRSIWQVQEYHDLVLCWKPLPKSIGDPKRVEGEMIREFKSTYDGKKPFANLRD